MWRAESADRLLVELEIHIRTHRMTSNKLVGAPSSPAESKGDSAVFAKAGSPHGLGIASSFCWFYRNELDGKF